MHYIKARQTGSSSEESFENLDSKSEAQIFWSQGRMKKMQFTNFVNRVTTTTKAVWLLFQYGLKKKQLERKFIILILLKRTTEFTTPTMLYNHHHSPFLGLSPQAAMASVTQWIPSSRACPSCLFSDQKNLLNPSALCEPRRTDVCAMSNLLHVVEVLLGSSTLRHVPQLNPSMRD